MGALGESCGPGWSGEPITFEHRCGSPYTLARCACLCRRGYRASRQAPPLEAVGTPLVRCAAGCVRPQPSRRIEATILGFQWTRTSLVLDAQDETI